MTTVVRPTRALAVLAPGLALALALALPLAAAQTRPPPEGSATGPFHLQDGRLVGSHVSFAFDREHGRIVEYTVDGRLIFDSIALTPSAVRPLADRDPNALALAGRGFVVRIVDGPAGGIILFAREGVQATLALDPADDLRVGAQRDRALALSDDEGPVAIILSPRPAVDGNILTVTREAAIRLANFDQPLPPPPAVRDRIEGAFERGRLGAEVVVERPGRDGLVTAYDNLTVSIDAQEGRLRAVVSAPDVSGRTLIFHVADAVLDGTSLSVTLNGQQIAEASDEIDVLNPDDDALAPEWFAVEGSAGVIVFVSLPHFSEWVIEIQSIEAVAQRAFPILGAAAAIAVVVVAGLLMVRGGKRDEL